MRSEKRNRILAVILALAILVSLPVTCIRLLFAAGKASGSAIGKIMKTSGTYWDREGNVLKDSQTPTPDLLGNLLGVTGAITNSLGTAFDDQLMASLRVNVFTGVRGLEKLRPYTATTTLLPLEAQQAIADAFAGFNGGIFAYNYATGEVYTALSLPSAGYFDEKLPEGSLYNKVQKGTFTPGSTMKIPALLVALQQPGIDLNKFTYTCTGKQELEGGTVTCMAAHGTMKIREAIGKSCNCFITAMASNFAPELAWADLAKMGIYTEAYPKEPAYLDRMKRSVSSTVFLNPQGFLDCWGFAGQGKTNVSCIDMAMIAGAVANGGSAAEPYLVASIGDPQMEEPVYQATYKEKNLFPEDVAKEADAIWKDAFAGYYAPSDYLRYAKTGTIENGGGKTSRSLLGVLEGQDTAFFIYVEGLPGGDPLCFTIAETLANHLKG